LQEPVQQKFTRKNSLSSLAAQSIPNDSEMGEKVGKEMCPKENDLQFVCFPQFVWFPLFSNVFHVFADLQGFDPMLHS